MAKITFTKGQGGLNRRLPGEDHISSLLFYATVTITAFATNKIQEVNSLLDAEALGIVDTTGTPTDILIMHYHVSEFYRINPGAKLFIAIYDEPTGAFTFSEIETIQNFAEGKIRNMGVWCKVAFATANMVLIQGILTTLEANNKPISDVLFASDLKAITTAALVTLRTGVVAPKVSGILAQDGANVGAALFTTAGYSITALGAILGAVSKAKVNECIGWVEKFPMNAVELDVPAFANGDLIKSLTQTTLDAVDAKGYIFLLKYESDGQVYINDSHTAVVITSDYAYIEPNRTMDKAIRQVRSALLPQLNGPVLVDPQTGQLAPEYVTNIENLGDSALEQMERDGELSGFKTFVDPAQNVLATSIVEVAVVNVPIGVSRRFNVSISYATKV